MKKIVSLFLSIFTIALFSTHVFAAGATTPYYNLNGPSQATNLKANQEPATHIQIQNNTNYTVFILAPPIEAPDSNVIPGGYIYHLVNYGYYGDTFLRLATLDQFGHYHVFFERWVSNHAFVPINYDLVAKGAPTK